VQSFIPEPHVATHRPASVHDATSPDGAAQAPVLHAIEQPTDGSLGWSAAQVVPQM
jgi:hypothetical protein